MTSALWVCFLTEGWQLTDDISFPHAGTSPSSNWLPTHSPTAPHTPWVRAKPQGLTSQTTHTQANGEEKDGERGVVWGLVLCRAARRRGQRGFGWGGLPYSEEIQEQGVKRNLEGEKDSKTKKTLIRFMTWEKVQGKNVSGINLLNPLNSCPNFVSRVTAL